MARATSTTRGKTKTTKRTASARAGRPAKKTTAAKAAVKAKATKASKPVKTSRAAAVKGAAAGVTTSRRRWALFSNVVQWHLISAIVFALAAVAAGVLMRSHTQEVTLGHLTSDVLASQAGTVFAPAQQAFYDLDIKWVLVVMLALSAVFSLLRATRLRALETTAVARRISPVRWLDYAVTYALMVEIVALLSGVRDLVTLKLLAGLTVLSFVLNWTAERENADAARPVRASYLLSVVSGALVVLGIAAYALATPIWGMVRSPWYVYALYAVLGLAFVLGSLNQWNGFRRFKAWVNYALVDRYSVLLNLLAKTAFAVVLIVGLYNSNAF